jgi:hypothetical protein
VNRSVWPLARSLVPRSFRRFCPFYRSFRTLEMGTGNGGFKSREKIILKFFLNEIKGLQGFSEKILRKSVEPVTR